MPGRCWRIYICSSFKASEQTSCPEAERRWQTIPLVQYNMDIRGEGGDGGMRCRSGLSMCSDHLHVASWRAVPIASQGDIPSTSYMVCRQRLGAWEEGWKRRGKGREETTSVCLWRIRAYGIYSISCPHTNHTISFSCWKAQPWFSLTSFFVTYWPLSWDSSWVLLFL